MPEGQSFWVADFNKKYLSTILWLLKGFWPLRRAEQIITWLSVWRNFTAALAKHTRPPLFIFGLSLQYG